MQIIASFKKVWWGARWPRVLAVLLIIAAILFAPIPFPGSRKGRIVDAKTKRPIAGAVVVGYWTYTIPTPAGGSTRCLDAREDVTDQNGIFSIPSMNGLFYNVIGQFNFVAYKVGYEKVQFWTEYDWKTTMSESGEWQDNMAVIELKMVPKLNSPQGWPPSVCGRRSGKALSALDEEEKKYHNARNHRK